MRAVDSLRVPTPRPVHGCVPAVLPAGTAPHVTPMLCVALAQAAWAHPLARRAGAWRWALPATAVRCVVPLPPHRRMYRPCHATRALTRGFWCFAVQVKSALQRLQALHVVVVPWRELHLGPRLGSGGFGEVFRAKWRVRPQRQLA